jgi:long-chain acyl-CoA synthetase
MESKNLHKINILKKNGKTANLQNIILFDIEKEEIVKESEEHGLKVYKYTEVIEAGKGKEVQFIHPTPDTIATFCYTSGTTGVPKGAMIHHGAILADLSVLYYSDANLRETDRHLSYLPLAHVMERVIFTGMILKSCCVGFSTGNPAKLMEDAQSLKPTVFVGVPRIYQRVHEVITAGIAKATGIKKALVNKAINSKLDALKKTGTLTHSIYDRLVFNKMKNALGGHVRYMITGSAPISAEVLNFLKICFSCPIFEGYGQTENCACATLTGDSDTKSGHVGGPNPAVEMKLVDCPALNYLSTDKDEEGKPLPRGEICLKGPIIFKGYFNDPENTANALDKDGWLHSGDVGCILPNGSLKILDRVKNIFKLSHGEYVAPEKLENVLILDKYVGQMMIHGESIENYIVAIIVPKKHAVVDWFVSQGKTEVNLENVHEHYNDEALKKEILTSMEKLGRSKDFKGFEVVKKVFLTNDTFTLENGLLTPTMKVKRHEVKNKYVEEIKQMYAS